MVGKHSCSACMAPLQLEDGHDLCPSCLGFEHLKEGLSDDPCMNCGIMPRAVRAARLAEVEQLLGSTSSIGHLTPAQRLVPDQSGQSKRQAAEAAGPTPAKKAKGPRLASKVDQLTAELNTMKSLFLAFQSGTGAEPPDDFVPSAASLESEDDVLSMAASAGQFNEYEPEVLPQMGASQPSGACSRSSTHSSTGGVEDCSMGAIIRMALARLQLDVPQTQPAPASAFFRRVPASVSFTAPPSEEYLRELQACWRDSRALSHATSDGRTLAAMQDAQKFGLDRMPAVEPTIAALIISPDEALRPDARCPRPQCRVTDDLLCKAYDAAARMGRISNSMSHLMLALSTSLQETELDASVHNFSDASLQAFALMSRELGRLMSTLVQARRQVWLAQSPLTEACRRTLCSVPVEPGELFGSTALEALERTVQAGRTRQQLSGLQRSVPPPSRPRGPPAAPQRSSRPQAHPRGYRRSLRPRPQPAQQQAPTFRVPDRLPSGQPQSFPTRRASGTFRGRGPRR
ncbi:uncharacterized protein [Misgurnus anguillicaudatus]|uniref:uncharacterized protein n=1 Tax=Misgurnus anguillicaudatus TaxID=75329 RepID=UPI003CCF2C00